MDDTVLDFGSEDIPQAAPGRVLHPIPCFFHLIFRSCALLVYLICGILGVGFITSFITILLLLSADFWTVKNITGRLLVGLRWWNKVSPDGSSSWEFEARKLSTRNPVIAAESRLFWITLIVFPILWVFMLFSTIFGLKLQWLAVVVIALTLHGANLYGYVRCKFASRKEIGSAATKYFGTTIFKTLSAAGGSDSAMTS